MFFQDKVTEHLAEGIASVGPEICCLTWKSCRYTPMRTPSTIVGTRQSKRKTPHPKRKHHTPCGPSWSMQLPAAPRNKGPAVFRDHRLPATPRTRSTVQWSLLECAASRPLSTVWDTRLSIGAYRPHPDLQPMTERRCGFLRHELKPAGTYSCRLTTRQCRACSRWDPRCIWRQSCLRIETDTRNASVVHNRSTGTTLPRSGGVSPPTGGMMFSNGTTVLQF